MAYLTFNSGPGSQQGMDIASAMLQQRMGGGSPLGGQNMSLMFRRDPRAATALIQAQLAAQESAADRSQRGDIAGQEMAYRNRALDTQGQMANADRQAMMERLMASLAGQRGLQGERLTAEQSMAEAARQAAMAEAAAQREFTRGQNAENRTFQSGESRLGREHQTGLAAMQGALQAAAQAAEQQGLDARSRMDLQGRVMSEFAAAAASQDPAAWATVQSRIPEIMAGIAAPTGQAGYAPPPKPEPKTVMGRFQQENPDLFAVWTALVGGQGDDNRKSATNFVRAVPEADIKANPEAFRRFVEATYPSESLDSILSSGFNLYSDEEPARFNRIRKLYGLEPDQTTMLRTWALPLVPPGAFDAFFGVPQ